MNTFVPTEKQMTGELTYMTIPFLFCQQYSNKMAVAEQ